MTKEDYKKLETANGYKFYMLDGDFVHFQAKRDAGYAAIRMSLDACLDREERLTRMRLDLTEAQ